MLINGIFCNWMVFGADRVRDAASSEWVVRLAGQKEQNSELDDTQVNDFSS